MFLVLGNVAVDEFMAATDWPSPGRTILVGPPRRDLGGKGANQAIVLHRTGAAVRFVATIGDDEAGRWGAAELAHEGLAADLVRIDAPTDRGLIFVSPSGENAIASTCACSDALTPAQAETAVATASPGDVLVLQGGLTAEANSAALRAARQRGLRTVFNPSAMRPGYEALIPLADLLVVNAGEATQLAGQDPPLEQAARLCAAGAGPAVITLGANGAVSSAGHTVPAAPATVVDTTGAGDCYLAVLAACLFARNLSLDTAMRHAAAAAAITVSRRGTVSAFPTASELAAILDF